jgi:hypothetical protein
LTLENQHISLVGGNTDVRQYFYDVYVKSAESRSVLNSHRVNRVKPAIPKVIFTPRKQSGNMRMSDFFVPHVESRNPLYVYLHIGPSITYCAYECSFSAVIPLLLSVLSECTRM